MASRTVTTCDRCGKDFEPTSGSLEEARLRGTVTLVPVRVGWALSDVVSISKNLSLTAVRAGAKDLCGWCSDDFRAWMRGRPTFAEGGPDGSE